jgi:AAA15 family ATPase/GTPase
MLLRFACKNFRSLRDEQELSLIATAGHEHEENLIPAPSIKGRVVRSVAVYGANASGKTNVIQALRFFDWMIETSHTKGGPDSKIPRDRFVLDENGDDPSYFEADLLLEGQRFTYGFEINDVEVIREWLYTYPSGKKVIWYERADKNPILFGRSLTGKNRVIESLTRKNSLFLSTAAQNNHEQLSPIFKWFEKGFHRIIPERRQPLSTAEFCTQNPQMVDNVKSLLKFADLGIVDFAISEEEVDPGMKEIFGALVKISKSNNGGVFDPPVTMPKIELIHQGAALKRYKIEAMEESSGTIAYFSILGPVLEALSKGTVLLIDELESSLHPSLATEIVRLFNDPKANCNDAQFIFTTHEANLLNFDILRRDQIWFTEKDNEGATSLYPLSDFSIRSDYNIAKGYLQGRFGAIPFLNDSFLKDIERLACE